MAGIHVTNNGPTGSFVRSGPTQDGVTPISVTSLPNRNTTTVLDNEQNKNNLDRTGKINWLGSSFSGADIRVVAHLYDTLDNDIRVARIQSEKDFAMAMRDGLQALTAETIANILGTYTDYTQTIQALAAGAGMGLPITPGEQRAAQTIPHLAVNAVSLRLNPIAIAANTPGGLLNRARKAWIQVQSTEIPKYQAMMDYYEDQIKIAQETTATATKELGELQTLSIETHRTKKAVFACGSSFPKGVVRGNRVIAGSMIFTVFDRHPLLELSRAMQLSKTYGEVDKESNISTYVPDQLPPIDITIVFANEYGSLSELRIYGVEFVNDSLTLSIEDLMSENICNFIARDIDTMTPRGKVRLSRLQRGMHLDDEGNELAGSDLLLGNNNYEAFLNKIGVRRKKLSV